MHRIERFQLPLAIIAVVAATGLVLIYPTVREAWTTQAQIAADRQALAAVSPRTPADAEADVLRVQHRLDELPFHIGEGAEPHAVLSHLADAAVRSGLSDYDITIRDAEHFADYSQLPVQIQFRGGFADAFGVIRAMAHSPRLMRAEVIRLERQVGVDGSHTVNAVIDLSAFFLDPDSPNASAAGGAP
ncbi:MAG: type 4a pilus biogenesis protein PilO [Planctomycetota bacterium]